MAKKTIRGPKPNEFYAKFKKKRQRRNATLVAGTLLLVFMLAVFFVLPAQLPWAMQKLFGIVNAILVALVALFAFREYGKQYAKVPLPLTQKKLDLGVVAAVGAFLLTSGWWLSKLAPIAVDQGGPEEIARLLGEEVSLAVLVMPDTTLAVIEPPLPPPHAAELASWIPNDADDYARLIKLIAERKYIEADALAQKTTDGHVDPVKLAVARGQLKVFSGEYTAAIEHFEQARQAGKDAPVLAQTAVAYALAGKLPKAQEVASQLLGAARSGQYKDPQALGISLNLNAALALSSGHFSEALALAEESQLHWEGTPDSVFKAASRNNQAVVYAMLPKKYFGAATQFDGALALWRDFYGAESAHVASNQANLGVLAMTQARFDEAESRLVNAREMATRRNRAITPGQFCATNALARLNTTLARYQSAEALMAAARDIVGQSPLFATALLGTEGSFLCSKGEYADAVSRFSRAISDGRDLVAPEHLFLADLRIRKATVNSLQGRFAETARSCREVMQSVDATLTATHPLVARASMTLGWDMVRSDKPSEARKQFEAAQQIFTANQHEIPISPDAPDTLAGLAQTHSRREWRAGIRDLRAAIGLDVQLFAAVLGAPSDAKLVNLPSTARYLYEQAVLFERNAGSSDLETAAQLFDQAMTMQEALLPSGHPALVETYEAYGKLLTRMDRKEQAEAMQAKAVRAREALRELE